MENKIVMTIPGDTCAAIDLHFVNMEKHIMSVKHDQMS